MPPTRTSCPQPVESGRAAVMRPLALGNDPNIAYIFNQVGELNSSSFFAELKRYDVTTGSKAVIVHLPDTHISEAQVSADGQWLLFVSNVSQPAPAEGVEELQLVRMDGQGLQTLFCAPYLSFRGVQWSPDQKVVVFSMQSGPGGLSVYLLNLANGAVQQELSYIGANYSYKTRTWPNNTEVYVVGVYVASPNPQESLFLLDTSKGPGQHQQDLLPVIQPIQPANCWDFDSDYEATRLITSSCTVSFPSGATARGIQQGPSSITVQSIAGGSAHPTFTSPTLAITQVRLLGSKSSKLLLIMENQNFGASVSVDTSQNGLWKMNTDGSGLTRLTTESTGDESTFNQFTQYPWSNVSVDGSLYALQVTDIQSKDPITNLIFGALDGGPTTTFAFANVNAGTVEVAGWTLM
jgi:eukaryotic-like serine/threonine-protein kinase